MKNSKIEWCDHTFNPWIGCTKVSPGCANCYAAAQDHRWGHDSWGPGKPRRRTSEANWKQPVAWDRAARKRREDWADGMHGYEPAPRRPRVFCASLADWLDEEVPIEWLADLIELIRCTPNLDWLLLTKRSENWNKRLVAAMQFEDERARNAGAKYRTPLGQFIGAWIEGIAPHRGLAEIPKNVWIGTTVEDQDRANQRIPALLQIPARIRFLSCEPLLGPVDLTRVSPLHDDVVDALRGYAFHDVLDHVKQPGKIAWVICGGESGPGARPMNPLWARSIRDQCLHAQVPLFFKQWGDWLGGEGANGSEFPTLGDRKIGPGYTWDNREKVGGRTLPRTYATKVGKRLAGRLLDGVEYSATPVNSD